MFSSQTRQSIFATFTHDPAADDQLPVFIAPAACTIESAYAVTANDVAASTANYFDVGLVNKGSAGTATTAISSADVGGTAGWSGMVAKSFTIDTDNNNLAAGDVVVVDYDETGTGTFGVLGIEINYVLGTGS